MCGRKLAGRAVTLGLAILVTTTACSAKRAPVAVSEPEAPEPVLAQPAGEPTAVPATLLERPVDLQPIYFEFDRWTLTNDGRRALRANAARIRQHPDWGVVTIEGHCDERGSSEYNLALGEKRAASVKRYLEDLGVPSSRFETVTFGEGKPAATGHDETAWRLNRRTELRTRADGAELGVTRP